MTDSTQSSLKILSCILLRCWIVGSVLLVISSATLMLCFEPITGLYSSWFDVDRDALKIIFLCALGLHKLFVNLLFLVPWIAIRWKLGRLPNQDGVSEATT